MHHRVGPVRGKDPVQRRTVADIGLFEGIERAVGHRRDIVEAGGIGQRVEIDHLVAARHGQPHHGRPDEPGPAGHEKLHAASSGVQVKGLSNPSSPGATASFSLSTGSTVSGQSMPIAGSFQIRAPSVSGA